MAELLKDQFYLLSFYEKLGQALEGQLPNFDRKQLLREVENREVLDMELKAKIYESAKVLHHFLPKGFDKQLPIVIGLGPAFSGLEGMFLPGWVELYGLEYPADSVEALKQLTPFSSAEFAIRPFIQQDQRTVLDQMIDWADHSNEHVRRLASEGCRPRLPWAMALPEIKKDPLPIFPILEKLKCDESLYVRKSVANNLNDITKDNPEMVLELVESWGFGRHLHTDWIIKQGLRGLIKQGHSRALKLIGYKSANVEVVDFNLSNQAIKMGDHLQMELSVFNKGKSANVMIDYVVHFVRDKGKMGKKVFKWKAVKMKANEALTLSKSHSFKQINTRRYYSGEHKVEIQINGEIVTSKKFELSID